jgi:hypothetical protein
LTVATGGLGGAGIVANTLRLAAVGAVYSGILTPTTDNTKNFFADRLTSGAVGAVTFAAMGAAAAGLEAFGGLPAPALRSVGDTILLGGATGFAGGAANAEATATIKEGNLLPSLPEFLGDVGTYTLFGAAFGAVSGVINRIENPIQDLKINDRYLRVYSDSDGNPFRVEGNSLTEQFSSVNKWFGWTSDKMPNGTWSTDNIDSMSEENPPYIESVVRDPDGSVNLVNEDSITHYGTDGLYKFQDLARERNALLWNHDVDDANRTFSTLYNNDENDNAGGRTFDKEDRVTKIYDPNGGKPTLADIHYDRSGAVRTFSVKASNETSINFGEDQSNPGTYIVSVGNSQYKFNGTIKPISSFSDNPDATVQFTTTDGKTFNYDAATAQSFVQTAKDNMQPVE